MTIYARSLFVNAFAIRRLTKDGRHVIIAYTIEAQSAKHTTGQGSTPPAWHSSLPFLYESTGVETCFTNGFDPDRRSQRVLAFYRPATLRRWIHDSGALRSHLCLFILKQAFAGRLVSQDPRDGPASVIQRRIH